jgi:spermidine/putrescine transport system permease protein
MTKLANNALVWAFVATMLAFIYLPVVILVLFSFQSGDLPVPPLDGPSLRWYERALANDRLTNSLWNSLLVGGLSSAAATLLGFLSAYGMFRHKPPAAPAIRLLLIAPLTVSYLIIGVGLLIVFNAVGVGRSLFAVGIGHVVINLPLCYAIIYSQFGEHLSNIDNAAHDLGAGDLTTLRRVIAPVMLPAITAAFFLSFTLSWDEFIISLLLSRFDVTLPVMTFELMRAGLTPEVNAAGTIVFAISFAAAIAAAVAIIFTPRRSL